MTKTFASLSCLDSIYRITKNKKLISVGSKHDHSYHDGIVDDEIPVTSIELVKEDNGDFLLINPRTSKDSWGNIQKSCLLKIEPEFAKRSSFETDSHIFFTTKEDRDSLLKEMALKEIVRFEDEIKSYTASRIKDIEEVRKNYFRVLNPSYRLEASYD